MAGFFGGWGGDATTNAGCSLPPPRCMTPYLTVDLESGYPFQFVLFATGPISKTKNNRGEFENRCILFYGITFSTFIKF